MQDKLIKFPTITINKGALVGFTINGLLLTAYGVNGVLAVIPQGGCPDDPEGINGDTWSPVSVNIANQSHLLQDGEFFADINNLPHVVTTLESSGIIISCHRSAPSGFFKYPVYRINPNVLFTGRYVADNN